MYQLFASDSAIARLLRQLADLFVLNFCFLLGSLPVFSIGASLSALYSVLFAGLRGQSPSPWRNFWQAWRRDLKPSLALWLPVLGIGALLWADSLLVQGASGKLAGFFRIFLSAAKLLFLFLFCHLFPLLAEFQNTAKGYWFKALFFSVCHFPTSFLLCLLTAAPWLLFFYSPRGLVLSLVFLLLLGFALQAMLCAALLMHIFRPFFPKEEVSDDV